jgi:hypothetical protein
MATPPDVANADGDDHLQEQENMASTREEYGGTGKVIQARL